MAHDWAMAFRIHDSVVWGEVDNRAKGIVRGRIWVQGRADPLVLELEGNALPDLAGCLLTFRNPEWRMTPEEEAQRQRQSAAGMEGFMINMATQRKPRRGSRRRWAGSGN
jgi:hypothetical protein